MTGGKLGGRPAAEPSPNLSREITGEGFGASRPRARASTKQNLTPKYFVYDREQSSALRTTLRLILGAGVTPAEGSVKPTAGFTSGPSRGQDVGGAIGYGHDRAYGMADYAGRNQRRVDDCYVARAA